MEDFHEARVILLASIKGAGREGWCLKAALNTQNPVVLDGNSCAEIISDGVCLSCKLKVLSLIMDNAKWIGINDFRSGEVIDSGRFGVSYACPYWTVLGAQRRNFEKVVWLIR